MITKSKRSSTKRTSTPKKRTGRKGITPPPKYPSRKKDPDKIR